MKIHHYIITHDDLWKYGFPVLVRRAIVPPAGMLEDIKYGDLLMLQTKNADTCIVTRVHDVEQLPAGQLKLIHFTPLKEVS